jgi:hypothetical protein
MFTMIVSGPNGPVPGIRVRVVDQPAPQAQPAPQPQPQTPTTQQAVF